MPDNRYNLRTTADGVREFRQIRARLAHKGGRGDLSSDTGYNAPQAVRLAGAAEPGTITPGFTLDADTGDVRPVEITTTDLMAFRSGRRGLTVLPQEYLAVLIDPLPAAPAVYPTGTITASDDELTTSEDLSAYVDDYTVLIAGAGTGGATLQTTIASATPTVATLADNAATSVTDAEVTILSIADALLLTTDANRRLVIMTQDGDNVIKPIVNRWRGFSLSAQTLIETKWQNDEWRLHAADCEASAWDFPVSS